MRTGQQKNYSMENGSKSKTPETKPAAIYITAIKILRRKVD